MKCFCTPRIALMNALTFYTRGLEMACKEMVCWHVCKCRMKSCTLKNDQTCMFFMFLCCFSQGAKTAPCRTRNWTPCCIQIVLQWDWRWASISRQNGIFRILESSTDIGNFDYGMLFNMVWGGGWLQTCSVLDAAWCSERHRRFEWELKDFGQFVLKVQSINPLDPLQIQQKSQPQKPMGKTFETFWYEFFSLFWTHPGALGFVEFESLVSWRPSVRAVGPSGTRVVLLPRGTATRPQGERGFC